MSPSREGPAQSSQAPPSSRDIKLWRRYLADERAEAAIYRDLARRRDGEEPERGRQSGDIFGHGAVVGPRHLHRRADQLPPDGPTGAGAGRHRPDHGEVTDLIRLQGLRLMGTHGALPEEQGRAQPFEVDVDMTVDLSASGRTDTLADTVHYGELAEPGHWGAGLELA